MRFKTLRDCSSALGRESIAPIDSAKEFWDKYLAVMFAKSSELLLNPAIVAIFSKAARPKPAANPPETMPPTVPFARLVLKLVTVPLTQVYVAS